MTETLNDVDRLHNDCVDGKPREFNFGEGYPERWDTCPPKFEAWTLEQCHSFLKRHGYKGPDNIDRDPWALNRAEIVETLTDIGIECRDDETVEELRTAYIANIDDGTIEGLEAWRDKCNEVASDDEMFAPMMNYLYPLPRNIDPQAAQEKILDTCCVIVLVDEEGEGQPDTAYMALAAGGMDLSWEICEAYMLLGQTPPFHFADLPRMADRPRGKRDKWIIAGARRSCEVIAGWATRRLESLEEMEK